MPQCHACNRGFTQQGYAAHLTQTHNPECIALCEGFLPQDDPASLPQAGPAHADNNGDVPEHDPVPFEGDFFGDYQLEEFDALYNRDHFPNEGHTASGRQDEDEVVEEDKGEDGEEDEEDEEDEPGWEPPPPSRPPSPYIPIDDDIDDIADAPSREDRHNIESRTSAKTFVEPFPGKRAGKVVEDHGAGPNTECMAYAKSVGITRNEPYAPFKSQRDWEFARWAKTRGPGATALTDLLKIEKLVELLGLSFKTSQELDKLIDHRLPSKRPPFEHYDIEVARETFEVFARNILLCLEAFWCDAEFAPLLVFAPEKHYTDANKTVWVYFNLHTGKWWWATQKEIEKTHPGATIVPLIVSSDKTQLTMFGNKAAYPVYLTIGNLPKEIRRKPLQHIKNKSARRRALANLFHACMKRILVPIKKAGVDGIPLMSGDGKVRRCHPILAVYVGDYPEQLLVTCRKTGDCPKCPALLAELDGILSESGHLRDLDEVYETLSTRSDGPAAFTRACKEARMRPIVEPFWEDLLYVNIFAVITPDILHRLYQGVIKHLVSWLKAAYGTEEINARCQRFPPNHHIRLFMKGITSLCKVTGKMHADICRFLLGLVIGLPLHGGCSPARLVRAVRALLDFLYLAQYPVHTTEMLKLLDNALKHFHANKSIFVELGIPEHFNIPKLHALLHYVFSITLFGTTDNYDTQYSERLHIDLAKDVYHATNRKDEYPQMTDWLLRKEKIEQYDAFCRWREETNERNAEEEQHPVPAPIDRDQGAPGERTLCITMARYPSVKAVKFDGALQDYGATYLRPALARFIALKRYPGIRNTTELERKASRIQLHFRTFPVWHRINLRD
ncbi:hypothetical protein C8Q72DRAFT_912150 [Fomitopsis betulina]|nr:hypothetical protein C8Q72DRAFT_912150 [Fomitopsis betulina]